MDQGGPGLQVGGSVLQGRPIASLSQWEMFTWEVQGQKLD